MAKIIKVDGDIVFIGNENGSFQEVRRSDCNFEPALGDDVDVFASETRTIVMKAAKKEKIPEGNIPPMPQNPSIPQGINITLQNSQTTPPPPYYAAPAYAVQSGGKVVNKVVYCLLAFFAGGIGIHKFYAGQIVAGILYLLFCWTFIPSLIALIELIIALCKPADVNGNIVM